MCKKVHYFDIHIIGIFYLSGSISIIGIFYLSAGEREESALL
jgi:hypothetical protein